AGRGQLGRFQGERAGDVPVSVGLVVDHRRGELVERERRRVEAAELDVAVGAVLLHAGLVGGRRARGGQPPPGIRVRRGRVRLEYQEVRGGGDHDHENGARGERQRAGTPAATPRGRATGPAALPGGALLGLAAAALARAVRILVRVVGGRVVVVADGRVVVAGAGSAAARPGVPVLEVLPVGVGGVGVVVVTAGRGVAAGGVAARGRVSAGGVASCGRVAAGRVADRGGVLA